MSLSFVELPTALKIYIMIHISRRVVINQPILARLVSLKFYNLVNVFFYSQT